MTRYRNYATITSTIGLFFGAILSLSCVIFLSSDWVANGVAGFESGFQPILVIGSISISLIIPVCIVGYSLAASLDSMSKIEGLYILILSYVVLIFSFGSGYYTIFWKEDLEDSFHQHIYYSSLYNNFDFSTTSFPPNRIGNKRAFSGIKNRLWTGIEEYSEHDYFNRNVIAPTSDIFKQIKLYNSKYKEQYVSNFKHLNIDEQTISSTFWTHYCFMNKWDIFFDCLHYSVVTISTVGYGDIFPQSRAAKVMTDIEIVAGQLLFLFALGVVLGKSSIPKSECDSTQRPD